MPWDLLDRMRDEDSTDRRRWTRRLRKRGGRRITDRMITSKHARLRWIAWQFKLKRLIAFDWKWMWPR
jgi:hypothetical protein